MKCSGWQSMLVKLHLPPARNKNLFARAIGVLNHRHAAATFTSIHRTHKPSGTGTKN